jgi:hypothetical protein
VQQGRLQMRSLFFVALQLHRARETGEITKAMNMATNC